MTTTDTDQGIEIVYQVGLRRIASRRFCVAVFNQLSTHLFTRQEIRDGVSDRSTAAVITFLSELLTKTPSIDVVRDESTLVYLISTITPDHPGQTTCPGGCYRFAAPIRHQDALSRRTSRQHPPHRRHPQDLVERTAYRPVPKERTALRRATDDARQSSRRRHGRRRRDPLSTSP